MENVLLGRLLPNDWGIADGASFISVLKIKAEVFITVILGAVTFISGKFKTELLLENKPADVEER